MHELGVLCHALQTVDRIAQTNGIERINFITLEIGSESSCVPEYFVKLYPVAIEKFPRFAQSTLKLERVSGSALNIKEIGY